jgi:hypothetical protein
MSRFINIAYEDELSKVAMEKILSHCGNFSVATSMGGRGFGYLKTKVKSFNKAACPNIPFFILTDLDSCSCPNALITSWLSPSVKSKFLIFRVAVREIESWILADRTGVSRLLTINIGRVPELVDQISDPKLTLVQLALASPNKSIREDLAPSPKSTAKVGKNYNAILVKFVQTQWNIEGAALNSPSLKRAIAELETISSVSSGTSSGSVKL